MNNIIIDENSIMMTDWLMADDGTCLLNRMKKTNIQPRWTSSWLEFNHRMDFRVTHMQNASDPKKTKQKSQVLSNVSGSDQPKN